MSSVASPVKKITFECRQCKFKISRAEKDLSMFLFNKNIHIKFNNIISFSFLI